MKKTIKREREELELEEDPIESFEKDSDKALTLREKNPVPFFDDAIVFDEATHSYTVNGEKFQGSVTSFIGTFFEKFDDEAVSGRIARSKRARTDTSYEYYGLSAQDIRRSWLQRRDQGTTLHRYIEDYYNKGQVHRGDQSAEFDQFLHWHQTFTSKNPDLEPFRSELALFSKEARLAGCVDMLFRRRDQPLHLVMVDWKRCPEIKDQPFHKDQCAQYPLHRLGDCTLTKYALQMNMYRHMLQQATDYRVDAMYLVQFHPTLTEARTLPVSSLQQEIEHLCTWRQLQLAQILIKRLQRKKSNGK